jgi:predicted ATP-dependent endonuclease of OLD family
LILKKISIRNFRSLRETQDFHTDQFVTVLIGANDHGKTNLLGAMIALNDDYDLKASDCNWDADDPETSPEIDWTFELTETERAELLALAKRLRAEQEAAAAALVEDENNSQSETGTAPTVVLTTAKLEGVASDPVAEETPAISDKTIAELEQLKTFEFSRSGVGSEVIVVLPNGLDEYPFVGDFLLETRPRVESFQGTTKIIDSIALDELDKDDNTFMQGIFRKAEIWDDRANLFRITARTQKRLADASQLLTQRIREEWQQGKNLDFLLGHAGTDGNRINLWIKDPSVEKQYVLPTQRSTGFSAFFGMSMALFARKEASPANNYIFVFDEPGTALHPHGQVNVQRVFETLSRKNQITFTTHSIFMVNKNFPTRNRVVTKTEEGTLIDHKPYIGNWKALRSNLGLIFANNFFVADTTLLVEGPSDVVYVTSLLRTCDRLKLIDVDLNLFSIIDAGNSADLVAMARIAADEGRRVVALVDGDAAGVGMKKKLDLLNRTLPKEVPKIETIVLAKTKSIEDMVVYPRLLREAIGRAAGELVDGNLRKFKEALDIASIQSTLDKNLASQKEVTLGRAMQDVSKGWFEDEEALSKLHVARIYDDLVEGLTEKSEAPVKADIERAKDLAVDLTQKLGLPEKAAKEAVVE